MVVLSNVGIQLLRSLIVIKNNYNLNTKDKKLINHHFLVERNIYKNKNKISTNLIKFKRLNKELKDLSNNTKFNINTIDNNNDVIWNVKLLNVNNIYPNLNIKIIFNNYPFIAPIIYVENYDTTNKNQMIDENNKIILPILKPMTWSLQNNMNDILNQVEKLFDFN